MKTSNSIVINAPMQEIYALASRTSDWSRILPHYRFVRTLMTDGDVSILDMGARRDMIPVQWTARQTNVADIPEIRFTHIRGWTRGMDVVWRFETVAEGTRVTIDHELAFQFPFASAWLGTHIVGAFFVHAIASKTLARIKVLTEATP